MRKAQLQKAMDTRLSGLRAKPEMRENVRRHMGEEWGGKGKMIPKLAAVLALILLISGGTVLSNRRLQDPANNSDPISAVAADSAATPTPISTVSPLPISTVSPLPISADLPMSNNPISTTALSPGTASPMPGSTPALAATNDLLVTVENTYYDGKALMIAYRIKGGYTHTELFVPTQQELDHMKAVIEGKKSSGIWLVARYFGSLKVLGGAGTDTSITFGMPDTGFNVRTVYGGEQVRTTGGDVLRLKYMNTGTDGEDTIIYYQFALLPEPLANADRFTLETDFVQDSGFYWYDGKYVYSRATTEAAYTITAEVVKTSPMKPKHLQGQWHTNGKVIDIAAEVTPTSITLRYKSMDGLEFAPMDPNTNAQPMLFSIEYREDGTVVQVFEGVGRIPDTLYACVVTVKQLDSGNLNKAEKTFNKWLRTLLEATPE